MWKHKIMAEAEKAAKLEQMSDQKRRMKMLELRRDTDRLLAERQRLREIEKTEEKLFWLEQKEAERQKQLVSIFFYNCWTKKILKILLHCNKLKRLKK